MSVAPGRDQDSQDSAPGGGAQHPDPLYLSCLRHGLPRASSTRLSPPRPILGSVPASRR